jgi:diguanylate cyclase (GGDEF)-like protein/PAS domain S-box-containing protein
MMKSNLRVLAIEDSSDDARIVEIMLNKVRHPVFTVVNAQRLDEGLQLLREQVFDVVLLDLGLPDSEGISAVRDIRKVSQEVPLIILSGLDDEEVAVKTLLMDVQDYLIKGQLDSNLLVRSIRYARERKRAIRELQASESRFRSLSESGIIGIAYFDISGRISDANDTFLSMIGYSREDLAKSLVRWDHLLPPEWLPNMLKIAQAFTETGRIEPYETECLRHDGSRFWGIFGAAKIEGMADGIAFIVDITGRKKLEEEIRHMAQHDALTGLPNRRFFLELIRNGFEEAFRNRKKMGLVLLDLDRFKGINDTMGHEAGDELLRTVADRLTSTVRKSDVVARIGGDEFSILLDGIVGKKDITEIVRKILVALRDTCIIAGREIHITTSMGISIYPDDSDDIKTLFRFADIALYRAKDRGRNTFAFHNADTAARWLPGISPYDR